MAFEIDDIGAGEPSPSSVPPIPRLSTRFLLWLDEPAKEVILIFLS